MTTNFFRGAAVPVADVRGLGALPSMTGELRRRQAERVVVDSLVESRLDRITHLATTVFGVPMATVTLVEGDCASFHASVGFTVTTAARDDTFCGTAVSLAEPLVVPDATADPRFASLPGVTGPPYLRFYAGVPLEDEEGVVFGTFCLFDSVPRNLNSAQLATLIELASWARRELIDSEDMARARRIQQSLLPRTAPSLIGYEVAGTCLPTRSVGGDFFTYRMIAGSLAFGLVDVMGKGAGAALVAATVRALMQASVSEIALGLGGRRPGNRFGPIRGGAGGVIVDIDRLIGADLQSTDTLVTGFFCYVEPETGMVRYADAGHGLTVLVGADAPASWLRSLDLPLGVVEDGVWGEQLVTMAPGDTLLCLSDGLFDLLGGDAAALDEIIQPVRVHPGAQDLVDQIERLATLGTPTDDVTAVAVHRKPVRR